VDKNVVLKILKDMIEIIQESKDVKNSSLVLGEIKNTFRDKSNKKFLIDDKVKIAEFDKLYNAHKVDVDTLIKINIEKIHASPARDEMTKKVQIAVGGVIEYINSRSEYEAFLEWLKKFQISYRKIALELINHDRTDDFGKTLSDAAEEAVKRVEDKMNGLYINIVAILGVFVAIMIVIIATFYVPGTVASILGFRSYWLIIFIASLVSFIVFSMFIVLMHTVARLSGREVKIVEKHSNAFWVIIIFAVILIFALIGFTLNLFDLDPIPDIIQYTKPSAK